jgi:PAS domain-containing protein
LPCARSSQGWVTYYVDVPTLRPGTIGAYLFAFVSVGVATAVRLAIGPYVDGLQFATYLPAVIITTLISGSGAGLLSVVLSCASIGIFVLPPRFSLYIEKPGDVLALFLYTAVMLFTVALMRVADQRRRDREALQASKDRLQFALDSALLGWWQYDPIHGVVWWDPRSKELFEIAEDWTGIEELNKRVHPDDIGRVWVAIGTAIDPTNPKQYATEFRCRRWRVPLDRGPCERSVRGRRARATRRLHGRYRTGHYRAQAARGGTGASRRDRDIVGRCHCWQDARRYRHELE